MRERPPDDLVWPDVVELFQASLTPRYALADEVLDARTGIFTRVAALLAAGIPPPDECVPFVDGILRRRPDLAPPIPRRST